MPILFQVLPVTDEIRQFDKLSGRSGAEIGFFAELPALGFAGYRLKKRPGSQKGSASGDENGDDEKERTKRVGKENFELPSIENEVRDLHSVFSIVRIN